MSGDIENKINFLDSLVQRKTFGLLILVLNLAGLSFWLYRSEMRENDMNEQVIVVLQEVKQARDQCQEQLIATIKEHNLVLMEDKERMYDAIQANTEASRSLRQAIQKLEKELNR